MSTVCLVLLTVLAGSESLAPQPPPPSSVWNVSAFGAVGDGAADNTAAFQKALDAARAANGGTVEVPVGRYRFEGVITIPDNVALRGTFAYAPAHSGFRDEGAPKPVYGSVLEPCAGAGSEEGPAFITLSANATLQGFTIHYPAQDPKAAAPTPYPYAIAMRGNNPAALDLQLLNPFNGIDASKNQRALIRNIHGQPIHIGVYVDQIYDIGRIENVHWNPWWTLNTPVYEWQTKHGVGFIFGRTDWHYVLNTFCFGYDVGYKFIATKNGATNGNFLGIGADDCYTAAVLVEDTAPMGVLITNGEFVSFHGPDPTMVRVEKSHTGTIRFVNCAFWGPCNRNAVVDGFGTVGFSDCTFMQWSHPKKGLPSIEARGGSILVRGCEFMEDKAQMWIGPEVERAIVTENLITGQERIEEHTRGRVVIKDNATSPRSRAWKKRRMEAPGFRAHELTRVEKKKD